MNEFANEKWYIIDLETARNMAEIEKPYRDPEIQYVVRSPSWDVVFSTQSKVMCTLEGERMAEKYLAETIAKREKEYLLEKEQRASEDREKAKRDQLEKWRVLMWEILWQQDFFECIPLITRTNESRGAILLKIRDSDCAFLVGDDLSRHWSGYGIKLGGEKIFFVCGCRNCGWVSDALRSEVQKVAVDHGVSQIIGRYVFEDIETFNESESPTTAFLSRHGLSPTYEESDNKAAERKERTRVALEQEAMEKRRLEEIEKADMSLFEEMFLMSEAELGTETGRIRLSTLLDKVVNKNNIFWVIYDRVSKRISNGSDVPQAVADLLWKIWTFNVLTVTKFQKDGESFWHLPPTDRSVNLEEDEHGDLFFFYTDGLAPGRHAYYLRKVMSGLDRSALEFIGTLSKDQKGDFWSPGILRIYTDLSYLKLFASRVEYAVLMHLVSSPEGHIYNNGTVIQVDDSGLFQEKMHEKADAAMQRSRRNRGPVFQYNL